MTAAELLSRLAALGVEISADGEKLHVRAAKGQLTDALKAAIAERKPELLALLRERGARTLAPAPRPAPEGPLPLSSFQERLWVLHRLEPGSTAYNLAAAWPSPGPVEPERALSVVAALVRRHETLRATIREVGGVASILLAPPEAVPVKVEDLRDRPEDAQWAEVRAALERAAHARFDLAREPPARFTVYRIAGDRVVIALSAHHIAVDAWSMRILGRELVAACGGAAPPPAPALQYSDFAAWQRASFDGEIAPQLEWWERRLAGSPPFSTLPPDVPGPPDERGRVHAFRLPRELADGLRALVREENATLYMALVGAFAAVLRWYTGQDDLVVGTALGVRERPELESVVGPFVNVLPLRLDLADDPPFAELLRRARAAVLDAYEHRQAPFETLVERLKPVRTMDHAPVFQTAVVMHGFSDDGAVLGASGGAILDLTWYVREQDGALVGGLEYRTGLFSEELVRRLAGRLEAMLAAAVADRTRRVSGVPLLAADERTRVVETFNATRRATDPAPFAARFERQAAATPDACAVGFEGTELTYRALDARANQLARHLRACGISRGVVAGVCLPRSPDLVSTVIAVQKAGGGYLPLDPDFPADRLSYMLADGGARAVVTSGKLPAGLVVPAGVAVVDLAAAASAIEALPGSPPPDPVRPADLAYLMYTSGSTGRPKGVRIGHAALSNFLESMREEPGLSPRDVLAAVTTLSFDIAGLELYLPLLVGARVEVIPKATASSGPALAEALARTGATILQATPATWRLLLEAGWRGPEGFRALCGGEPMPRELADALLARVGELWNVYGPTETTIWSTLERVQPGKGPVLIGKPIANTTVDIVRGGQPLPPGVPGEIWIGGDGVAEGYHGRPDLTAERFLPDPLRPGARVYRTGDLGRWTADGRLEHLGRLDHQVKVRGFRIELGEVESVLAAHPAVKHAVVLAREAGAGDVRLVAYLVYRPGEDLTVSEVRKHLRRSLPEYMVPSIVVAIDAVPLTPNGKLDRAKLPDPMAGAARAAAPTVPPAPGTEQALAEIWREALRVEAVGAEDNFFELGGHSLLSLRVASAVEQRLGWRMDPRMLFFRNLRQLAAAADAARAGRA